MTNTLGVRSIAMRNERHALEVAAAAATRIADEITILAWHRRGWLDTVCIRLRAVKSQGYRDVDRRFFVEQICSTVEFNRRHYNSFFAQHAFCVRPRSREKR